LCAKNACYKKFSALFKNSLIPTRSLATWFPTIAHVIAKYKRIGTMVIDQQETLITLTEAAKILPLVNGKRINISTLWRWCRKGLHGVTLEYTRVGAKIATSAEAMQRFFAQLVERDEYKRDSAAELRLPKRRSIKKERRQKAIDEANAILARAGI
jgi:hypothetical protein